MPPGRKKRDRQRLLAWRRVGLAVGALAGVAAPALDAVARTAVAEARLGEDPAPEAPSMDDNGPDDELLSPDDSAVDPGEEEAANGPDSGEAAPPETDTPPPPGTPPPAAAPAPPPAAPAPVPPAARPAPAPTLAPTARQSMPNAPASKEIHVVRAGDTLWSMAASRLGPGASAARISAEVRRLWNLNRSVIRSGNPDMIAVGERLRLD